MRIAFTVAAVAVLSTASLLAGRTNADDGYYAATTVDYSSRMKTLEAELRELNARLGELEHYGGGGCDGTCGGGCDGVCDQNCETCCDLSAWNVTFDALFLQYNRADGARVGIGTPFDTNERVDFDFKFSPRISLAYVTEAGLGIRGRWWQFDQSEAALEGEPSRLDVETYTIDVELFHNYILSDRCSVEFSAGVRYNEFKEVMVDAGVPFAPFATETRVNRFDGWGLILGVEPKWSFGCYSALFARGRGGILIGDKVVGNEISIGPSLDARDYLFDSTQGIVEVALGYEYARPVLSNALLTIRAGAEYQHWYNYSSSYLSPDLLASAIGLGVGESIFTGPSDVGFGGISVSAGLEW